MSPSTRSDATLLIAVLFTYETLVFLGASFYCFLCPLTSFIAGYFNAYKPFWDLSSPTLWA